MKDKYKKGLSLDESLILVEGGTEAPFTGEYNDFYIEGSYVCRSCGLTLFESDSKFNSECGWPSFDDAMEGTVVKKEDVG